MRHKLKRIAITNPAAIYHAELIFLEQRERFFRETLCLYEQETPKREDKIKSLIQLLEQTQADIKSTFQKIEQLQENK